MSTKVWNKEEIKNQLETNQAWLERGILAIYAKQTQEEKNKQDTIENNGVGCRGCDARRLTYYAKWLQNGNHLSGKHLEMARKMMLKYSGQLTKIANGKI